MLCRLPCSCHGEGSGEECWSILDAGSLHSIVELVLKPGDVGKLLKFLELPVGFVADERAVKMDGKDNEDEATGDDDGGGGVGGGFSRADPGGVWGRRVGLTILVFWQRFLWEELDPAEQQNLSQEQEGAYDGGERPGQLHVTVHALVRRLLHWVQVVDVTHGLDVGQDTSADHQSEEMDRNQHRGAGAERDQEEGWVLIITLQLHLHHRHLHTTTV